ncbi:DUF6615 family protein [Kribbella sp. NPDC023972]|uniref:DUF6615 family protein n=1 Tax=Kribbella sp. NPDC023972 TaxID=3154795 RepID=UPI0033F4C0C1
MTTNLLATMSEWTWHFLRDASFRPREETITESLLIYLERHGRRRVWVYKATTGVEARAGLDWAWALRTGAGWVNMIVQAKQADGKRFAKYPELRKRDAADQVGDLLHTAAMASALPVYAFYQGEIAPFGKAGESTSFGACLRHWLKRGAGLPWKNDASAMGISVAHAEDVRDFIVQPPAPNQQADTVNLYAMPLECLLCPNLRKRSSGGTGKAPRIQSAAARIALGSAAGRDESIRPNADSPIWIRPEQPEWVGYLMEGLDPRAYWDDNAPDVSYYLAMDLVEEH